LPKTETKANAVDDLLFGIVNKHCLRQVYRGGNTAIQIDK
jgi:hypothetical protein